MIADMVTIIENILLFVVLCIPGMLLSYVLLPAKVDKIERILLSVLLSLSIVPLLVFYLSVLGIKPSRIVVSAVSLFVVVMSGAYLYLRKLRGAKNV